MTTNSLIRFSFTVFLICGVCPIVQPQENNNIVAGLEGIRDPFMSQMPPPRPVVITKPVPVVPVEVVPNNNVEQTPVNIPINVPKPPEVVKKPNMDSIVLKGVVWNSDIPQAIINNKVMNIGDEINGLRIVAITRDGVEFSSNGVKTFVTISQQKGVVAAKP